MADAVADAYSRPPVRAEGTAGDGGAVRATPTAGEMNWRLIVLIGYAVGISLAGLALLLVALSSQAAVLGNQRR